ncbi:hypothetical protein AB205_0008810 [Aquarana catesbeiana]|uniref:Uncharacterized protein n=1 Tax=Aquarana catesbeiana TaxID=8400 RepID=A0A2G9S5C6_AQUCT|nr:hypothetical protein AB205_0008810 [Aquarana catesbeiana]
MKKCISSIFGWQLLFRCVGVLFLLNGSTTHIGLCGTLQRCICVKGPFKMICPKKTYPVFYIRYRLAALVFS